MSSKNSYEKLRKIWYEKLKHLGFNDIEQDDNTLKRWHSRDFFTNNKINPHNHQAKADYYYHAEHFLNSHKFQTEMHKIIWEEHVNGCSSRIIADKLKAAGFKKCKTPTVKLIIKHYREIMKKQL